jgi:thiol:disulfide interchange protein DsbD
VRPALRLACLALSLATLALPAGAGPTASTAHVTVALLSERPAVAPGETVRVGLRFDLAPHWHVYWRNPGDSGAAPRFNWRLPEGWRAGAVHWPVPSRIRVGPLTNYGYEGSVTFIVPVEVGAAAGGSGLVAVRAAWLVCQEECVPEEAELSLTLPVTEPPAPADEAVRGHFEAVAALWPVPLSTGATYTVEAGRITLRLAGLDWPAERVDDLWLASEAWGPVAASGAQRRAHSDRGIELSAPVGDAPPAPGSPLAALLVLQERTGEAIVTRGFSLEARPDAGTPSPVGPSGLPAALALALLGGLILNLMPCVLPVLSLKAMGLLEEARADRGRLARHGLSYAAGVLASFAALAVLLLALRAGGASLGWGFQLQSPVVVTLLAFLMLLVGLNLSGVFPVGHRLMGAGEALAARRGAAGAFGTGVLASVVASPCTAPFMGAALGYAVTRPAPESLAVFLALGTGFALPVVALGLSPGWARRLPRPGPWMVRLKEGLAFPMYAAAAWLLWVLAQQTSPRGLAAALAGLVLVGLAAWLYGQRRHGWRPAGPGAGLAALASLALLPLVAEGPSAGPAHAGVDPWSPARLDALRAEGRPVLVNFTADWCITCKVNEQVALASETVTRALAERNVAYLKADWTRRDPLITRELERHGRGGVPLYLLYPPSGAPAVLPQLLTEGLVLEALERIPHREETRS